MQIQIGKHVVSERHDAFLPFANGEGQRHFDHVVKFALRFEEVPQVLVALNHLDVGSEAVLKLHVTAEDVSATGFILRYSTWANSHVIAAGAQWIAFHGGPGDFTFRRQVFDLKTD